MNKCSLKGHFQTSANVSKISISNAKIAEKNFPFFEKKNLIRLVQLCEIWNEITPSTGRQNEDQLTARKLHNLQSLCRQLRLGEHSGEGQNDFAWSF